MTALNPSLLAYRVSLVELGIDFAPGAMLVLTLCNVVMEIYEVYGLKHRADMEDSTYSNKIEMLGLPRHMNAGKMDDGSRRDATFPPPAASTQECIRLLYKLFMILEDCQLLRWRVGSFKFTSRLMLYPYMRVHGE